MNEPSTKKWLTIEDIDDWTTRIGARCKTCSKVFVYVVPTAYFNEWEAGTSIQVCFPSIPAEEREILISGYCDTCFDSMIEEML